MKKPLASRPRPAPPAFVAVRDVARAVPTRLPTAGAPSLHAAALVTR